VPIPWFLRASVDKPRRGALDEFYKWLLPQRVNIPLARVLCAAYLLSSEVKPKRMKVNREKPAKLLNARFIASRASSL
jgi:hypothetical protein